MFMKKEFISKICNILSIALVIIFIIKNIIDYSQYNAIFTSAPFYVCIIVNAIYFLLPALIIFIISIVVNKKL